MLPKIWYKSELKKNNCTENFAYDYKWDKITVSYILEYLTKYEYEDYIKVQTTRLQFSPQSNELYSQLILKVLWNKSQIIKLHDHSPPSDYRVFSAPEHPVDPRLVWKLKFVHCGPVERSIYLGFVVVARRSSRATFSK